MKANIAFITLTLCDLDKKYWSHLCIFVDVIYIHVRIEITMIDVAAFASKCTLYMHM